MKTRKMIKAAMLPLAGVALAGCATQTVVEQPVAGTKVQAQKQKSLLKLNFSKDVKDAVHFFSIPENNQIVIDLLGADQSAIVDQKHDDAIISKVTARQSDKKLRVVIDTKMPVKYGFTREGDTLLLLMEENEVFEKESSYQSLSLQNVSQAWKEKHPAQKSVALKKMLAEITNINLKKNEDAAVLTVDLSKRSVPPTFKREGDNLVIGFKGVSAPAKIQRKVSAQSMGVVTQEMTVSQTGNDAQIVLKQKQGWDYSFTQVENKFVVTVKPKAQVQDKKYAGKNLSISFQDIEVRAVLQSIADFTGLNIMSSDKVEGNITIRLKDVPWDQALNLVLESRGLQMVKEGNVIWVATAEEVKANNESKLALKTQNEELAPLKLEFFQINYYRAADLKKVLESESSNAIDGSDKKSKTLLSKRGTVGLDERNNILFIQDTEERINEVRRIIKKLDVANKQVLVEAKIVIASTDFGRELGSKFGINYRGSSSGGANRYGIGGNLVESATLSQEMKAATPLTSLAAAGLNSVTPGAIGVTLLKLATGNAVGVELSALEQRNMGKVLSSPRLLTADNKKATIEQGTEIPYVTPGTANSPPTVSFKKAVLKLDVTPQIAPNGKVVLDLDIRKDTIGQLIPIQGGGQIPSIDTKNVNTVITVNNGQTVVLGGVYEISSANDWSKIPLLGDVPVLGNLFKHTRKTEDKGELMIFITPYVIEEMDLDDGGVVIDTNEINLSK